MYTLKNKKPQPGTRRVNVSLYYEGVLMETDGIVHCQHLNSVSTLQKNGYELISHVSTEEPVHAPDEFSASESKTKKASKAPSLPPVYRPGLMGAVDHKERNPFDTEGVLDRIEVISKPAATVGGVYGLKANNGFDNAIEANRFHSIFLVCEGQVSADGAMLSDLKSTFALGDLVKIVCPRCDTGIAMLIKRSLWREVGGMGESEAAFDFCARAAARGHHAVWRHDVNMSKYGGKAENRFGDFYRRISSNGHFSRPLVSVILPTFNRRKKLARSIQSIERQQVSNPLITWEIIVVDDGSDDGTCGWLIDLARENDRIRVFRWPENTGEPARLVNMAVWHLARGEFVIHAFDDDIWFPKLLESLASRLLQDRELGWVHGLVRAGGNSKGRSGKDYGGKLDLPELKRENYIPLQGCMFRRSEFLRIGGFDESEDFRCGYDWDMAVRAGESLSQEHVPELVAEWRPSPDGMIGQMWKSGQGNRLMKVWRKKWEEQCTM